jgi:radical SAM superfamily enzyme YgiQ (UPF0313 family)
MRIGFIALCGVRAVNRELLEAGLTLPGFVERSEVIAQLPSLGLLTLAGLTPESWKMEYVEVVSRADFAKCMGKFDVAAISTFSMQAFEAYELADSLRIEGTKVILGGIHVTLCPDEASQHADAVILGEGEVVWRQVLADAESGRLRSVYDARERSYDLSESPLPRFDLLDASKYTRFTLQTQRGCVHHCDFCASSPRISSKFKTKPTKNILAEIRAIKALKTPAFIELADDNTFASVAHGQRVLDALEQEPVRWFTETDIRVADNTELLKRMKASGCAQVLIGLESPTASALNGIELRNNWKSKQREHYLRSIETIQNHGITVNGCFILGLDGSSHEEFDSVFEFVRASGLYEVQITILTPFPGTPLYQRFEKENRLTHQGQWDRCTLFDVNFLPSNMSQRELEAGFLGLAKRIYDQEFIDSRRRRFFDRLSKQ